MKRVPEWLRPWTSGALSAILRRRATALAPPDARPLLVIVPHQDDETFGCGGLIALKRRRGAAVSVAFTTDGANSHAGHPVLTPERLAPLRRREALAALGTLGVAESGVHFLDGPDGGLTTLSDADRARTLVAIGKLLEHHQPAQVCVTFRGDRHPDHEATHALVLEAVRAWGRPVELLEFPVWILWQLRRGHLQLPEFRAMQKLDIGAVRSLKHRAIACFASQLKPTPPRMDLSLPRGFERRFHSRWELFLTSKPNGG